MLFTKHIQCIFQLLLLTPALGIEQLIKELAGEVFPGSSFVVVGGTDFMNSFANLILIPTQSPQLLLSNTDKLSKLQFQPQYYSAIFGMKLSLGCSLVYTQLFVLPQEDHESKGKSEQLDPLNYHLKDLPRIFINSGTLNSLQSEDLQKKLSPFKHNLIVTRNPEYHSEIVKKYTFSTFSKYSWNPIIHLEAKIISKNNLFPDLLTNLNKCFLRISLPKIRARIATKIIEGEERMFRGLYKTLLENFARIRNASLGIVHARGGGTSNLIYNVWNGVMGDIMSKNADIGISVATTLQRYEYVEFSSAIEHTRLTFVTGKPMRIYSWNTLLWPFHSSTWACLFVCVIVVMLILDWIQRHEKYSHQINKRFYHFDILLQMLLEKSVRIPSSHASKMVICGWLLFSLNAATVYKSKYFALLAKPKTETIPKTFQELANSDFSIGLQYLGGAEFYFINTSTSPSFVEIRKDMELIRGLTACYAKTIGRKFCCIAYREMLEYSLSSNFSDKNGESPLVISSDTSFEAPTGLVVQKGTIILEKINRFIGATLNGGLPAWWTKKDMEIVKKLKLEWQKRENLTDTFSEKGRGPIAISLKLLSGGILLALAGWALSLFGFFLEISWFLCIDLILQKIWSDEIVNLFCVHKRK
ncbi:unnamed protein product [Allacma fusca]|uniref:Uncharacterized protein n=1 Tax=Allacma fusca TaxID=39272 RepID=A0A8J2JJL1_9HEXA|nr:unnamed protein product [Allacma fusca]